MQRVLSSDQQYSLLSPHKRLLIIIIIAVRLIVIIT